MLGYGLYILSGILGMAGVAGGDAPLMAAVAIAYVVAVGGLAWMARLEFGRSS